MVHSSRNLLHLKTLKMPSELKLELPIYYTQEFKTKPAKTFLVGLNWERNAHYFIKNEVKKYYHSLIAKQVPTIDKPLTTFKVHTKLYYKNPSSDGRNIVPMIEKYLLDGLQECNILTNDNVKYDIGGSWEVAGKDKNNPRCEITVKGIE